MYEVSQRPLIRGHTAAGLPGSLIESLSLRELLFGQHDCNFEPHRRSSGLYTFGYGVGSTPQ